MTHTPTTTLLKRFAEKGLSAATILAQLQSFKAKDIPWQTGRAFAYVFEPSAETKDLIKEAYSSFLSENALDPSSFPSLLKLETDIVGIVAELLGGDEQVVGNFTSGGTESIILAVKTARDYFRHHRPDITQPELIVAETAHAAFHKAAHYLGVKLVIVPVNKETFQVEISTVANAITPNTILLVGSAPNYSHGVIDPIVGLADLAKQRGIFCHVDACVGGCYLPFLEMLGYDVPAFNFQVEGVTSMSCDLHKYGYAAKGASVVLYKNPDIRQFQLYVCSDWTGYTIINPTVMSSKTGGPLAGAWAVLHHLGVDGYKEIVQGTQGASQQFIEGIGTIPELRVLGKPVMNLVAVVSQHPQVDIFEIAEMMKKRGWYLQTQLASNCSAQALHLNINRANVPFIPELIQDLKQCIQEILARTEARENIDASFILEALQQQQGGGEQPDIAAMFGLEPGQLPDDFVVVNNLLNQMPPQVRTFLLTQFVNALFTPK